MLLFNYSQNNTKLIFRPLSECLEHLELAATWIENEWGYIRNRGIEYRKEILSDMKYNFYIGLLIVPKNKLIPVATFALNPKREGSNFELMYVYIDNHCRDLGFGKQVIAEAKKRAKEYKNAKELYLDTLNPRLTNYYAKQGATFIAEGELFKHPTDIMAIKLR